MRREQYVPNFPVEVTRDSNTVVSGVTPCVIGKNIKFDAAGLQSYFTRGWEDVVFDGMVVAAAVEFCDRAKARPSMDWPRKFKVRVPVHEPSRWNSPEVKRALIQAIELLSGDYWAFEFVKKDDPEPPPAQSPLPFEAGIDAVIPFSDGLDSLAVSAIVSKELLDRLVRVRVGSKKSDRSQAAYERQPFTAIPFRVSLGSIRNGESSGRSRSFKFAMISGLAAYLVRAPRVIVPESGQGALGPVLVNVGHAYPDRRSHPQFTIKMATFLSRLLGWRCAFEHPMIWGTKGQTLRAYLELSPGDESWRSTRSCWQDARHASVNHRHRQCGVCAACLLRRSSLHAAGLEEASGAYVWEDLRANDFWQGANKDFNQKHEAFREYAIAGVLHMDHLASLHRAPHYEVVVNRQALVLSKALGVSVDDAKQRIRRLIGQHADEWKAFIGSLSNSSFISEWAQAA